MPEDWNVLEEERSDQQRESPSGDSSPHPKPPYHDEKAEEKQGEKEEEKGSEKGRFHGEKWVRDTLATITWGLIVIWAGLVFFLANMGREFLGIRWDNTWSWIFLGAGLLLLLEIVLRLVIPDYRRPVGGRVFLAVILLAIGLGGVVEIAVTWPIILIAVGLVILFGAFRRPDRK